METVSEDVAVFYRRTCPGLVGLLASIGGSRDEAEEVAQDAYVALLPRWHQVSAYEDPEAWLRTVAVRGLISRQRRTRARKLGLNRLAHEPFPHARAPSPDSVAVSRALESLSVGHRAVIVLHHALDLSVEQVAEELQIPVGTVKSRLARGRAAMRSLLAEEEGSR